MDLPSLKKHNINNIISMIIASLVLCILWTSPALSFGVFINDQGIIEGDYKARVFVTRGGNGLIYYTQAHFAGDTTKETFWLIPVPNIANIEERPPQTQMVSSDIFDELADSCAPLLLGECQGVMTEERSIETLNLRSGEASQARVSTFDAIKLEEGRLQTVLENKGVPSSSELNSAISWAIDQNMMIMMVTFDPDELSDRDPVIRIELNVPEDTLMRVALRFGGLTQASGVTDLSVYVLDQTRFRSNFPTNELEFDEVSFTSEAETNYVQVFDQAVFSRQSQIFFTEYADEVNDSSFTTNELRTLRGMVNGTFLTRLRARLYPQVLTGNGATITLRSTTTEPYSREHTVISAQCNLDPSEGGSSEEIGGSDASGGTNEEMGGMIEGGTMIQAGAGTDETEPDLPAVVATAPMNEETVEEEMSPPKDEGGCRVSHSQSPIFLLFSLVALLSRRFSSVLCR